MRIGIDARMHGPNVGGGGLGRYVEQFVTRLPAIDHQNRYVLFVKRESGIIRRRSSIFSTVETDIHWYTLQEQVRLGPLIDKQKLDLVHFPHWNVPMNLKTPFVVTIHDLILLEQPRSARATTRNRLVFALKYLAYKRVLRHAIEKSKKIIAVSQYTKQSIIRFFPNTDPDKIVVIYEGVTFLNHSITQSLSHSALYLLTIGNSYPHKNLDRLIMTFERIAPDYPDLRLTLAGLRDVFFDRLEQIIARSPFKDRIDHVADPDDSELARLYANARLYVFPSLAEGFGLPGLEAMSFDVPVVSSRVGSLPEIFENAAVYFDPLSVDDMTRAIQHVLNDQKIAERQTSLGREQLKHYDWNIMTRELVRLYNSCAT